MTITVNPITDYRGSPVTTYKFYIDDGANSGSFNIISGYDGASSTYEITSLTSGVITASNSLGESD